MQVLLTSKGEQLLVDDEDFAMASRWTWRTIGKGYAARTVYQREGAVRRTNLYLHRALLDMRTGDHRKVDHINGNKLDNRRSNLRICTTQENGWNSAIRSHNRSGFKGVMWEKRRRKWALYIKVDGKQKYLGLFDEPQRAHEAYCTAAHEHFGEFARGS